MIVSMTGFGKSETKFQRKKLNAEIRSLNSKNIDLNLRIPNRYREIESNIRTKVNGKLSRGKIDLLISIDIQDEDKTSSLNYTVIKKYINELVLPHHKLIKPSYEKLIALLKTYEKTWV